MSAVNFQAEVRGDLIIVTDPVTEFFAIYVRRPGPQLVLMRRAPTGDEAILAGAWQVANTKAAELGWIT